MLFKYKYYSISIVAVYFYFFLKVQLDKETHPYDLLNTHLAVGMRKLPSEIDVEILQAILESEVRRQRLEDEMDAALTSNPLMAIAFVNFSISDNTTDNFIWKTKYPSGIESCQVLLIKNLPES
jgi:large repetitive protein